MSFRKEFRSLPALERETLRRDGDPEVRVSLLIPAKNAADFLEHTVSVCHRYLRDRYDDAFEIVLIPNPGKQATDVIRKDFSIEASYEIQKKFSNIQVVIHESPRGKGAALRTGFGVARGQWIFFTDSDLPYDLSFFDEAAKKLELGFDLVTGNRRLPTSYFDIPVELLPIAYKRHRLGLWFNRVVRFLMPIRTIDTQAGIKAMSRRLANQSFENQFCPGFFFDIEFFLTALEEPFRACDLPVALQLKSEKSTVKILRESMLAGYWLLRIAWNYRRGKYAAD